MKQLIFTIAFMFLCAAAAVAAQTEKPNVLFILVDDMGWRDLACYGHEVHETPNIDGLASRGMRFTNAYAACPICAPSRAAIMTGKFPSNTGFVDNFASELNGSTLQRAEDRQFLKLEEVTVAETLKAGGYQTGFLGKWHLSGTNESRLPTDQGFDVNVAGGWWGHPRGRTGYFSPYNMFALENGPKGEYLTDRLTTEAIGVMDKFSKQDKPWLLYMSYYTVHGPLHSKKEKTKKYTAKAIQQKVQLKSAAYAGMVESLDENVGRMLDWLEEKNLRENTIVIFTSDNGGMVAATDNRPLRSFKGDIYEGGIRVPCIIDWPGVIEPGSVSDTPVSGVDFYSTLLAMTGLPQQGDTHEDSVNLVPLFKGDTDFNRGPLVWHYPVGVPHIAHSNPGSVIRDGDWKFLRFYQDGREELYNLRDDIGETKNLAASMPKKAAELKSHLDTLLQAHNAEIPIDVPAKPTRRPSKKKPIANKQDAKPNIIFILADDMGYNGLSCYGATRIKTPNLDRLAAEGIRFTDGHCAASTCTPTRYAFMTGRYPFRSWCSYSALSTNAPLLIEVDRPTVPSFLKSHGYSTSIIGKWHLGYGEEKGFADNRGKTPPNHWKPRGPGPDWNGELKPGPLENGFDYSYVIPVANSFPPYVIVENRCVVGLRPNSPIGQMESKNSGKMEGGEGARWKDEDLVDMFTNKLVSQLESYAKDDKPFFLYYPAHQPHLPWRPNARFKGSSQAQAYGDVIQELDWSVGELLKTLDRLELTDNTIVIFSSDNGASGRDFNGHSANGSLRGGKGDLTEGGHRVPFIVRWPDRIKPGLESNVLVSQSDLFATFAAIIGEELPTAAAPDSYNILPALLGEQLPNPARPVVMSSGGTGALSIRSGKWKLMLGQGNCGYREFFGKKPHPAPKPSDPPAQLYDVVADPAEEYNLYTKHPEIVQRQLLTMQKIQFEEGYKPNRPEQLEEQLNIKQLNTLLRGESK